MNLIKYADSVFKKHGTKILTGLGVAGLVTTTILAIEATPKAVRIIEEKKKKEHKESLTKKETVSLVWKCYIPTGVSLVASAACIMGAYSEGARRNAALATAYSLTQSYLDDYRSKTKEVVGEKKEKQIREAVMQDRLDRSKIREEDIIETKHHGERCYDSIIDRKFWSDISTIEKAVIDLNKDLQTCMYVSLNDFYRKLDLPTCDIGDEVGWNIDDGPIEITFGSMLKNDLPYIVLSFQCAPRTDYTNLH